MRESKFEQDFCKKLKELHPHIQILKNDSSYRQGIPDRIVLFRDKYAMLEFKRSQNATHRPNQDWYVEFFNKDAYAAFVYPENGEDQLSNLKSYFGL